MDGYNFMKRRPQGECLCQRLPTGKDARGEVSLEEQRGHVVRMLAEYRRIKRFPILVVFDGVGVGRGWVDGVEVCYRPSADEYIIEVCDAGSVVVSSDSEVQERCRTKGASVVSSEEFYEMVVEAFRSRRGETGSAPRRVQPETRGIGKKGNPHRLPKKERKANRMKEALRRLLT